MAKPEYVHLLINSLTKSEKRFFKRFSQSTGSNDYLLLYQLMLKSEIDGKNLKINFSKMCPSANFNITCQHLYNTVTRCLILLESRKDIENTLTNKITEAKVLFGRDLYDESFNVIRKAKTLALKFEKFNHYLILCRLELQYLGQLEFFGIDENHIIKIQSKIEQISRQQRAIDNHSSLYEIIHYRQLTQGTIRNTYEKDKLNDLVFNELQARSLTKKESFEAQKQHLLFQSAYFMLTANPKSSLKAYSELNKLFEENKEKWGQPPLLYLQHLRGILNNLRIMEKFEEMAFFLNKARQVEIQTKSAQVLSDQLVFLFESLLLTDTGKYDEAEIHYIKSGETLTQKAPKLPLSAKAELYLQIAIIKFGAKKYHEALKTIQHFLNMGKNFLSLPIIKMIRMFGLIVHMEMQHPDYLEYEIKSFERELKITKKLHTTEKMLFQFIRKYNKCSLNKERTLVISEFINNLKQNPNPQFDFQLFGNFRFTKWLEGKLTKGIL